MHLTLLLNINSNIKLETTCYAKQALNKYQINIISYALVCDEFGTEKDVVTLKYIPEAFAETILDLL
ncbi:hypothetical protein [Dysgonomonas sp. 521]|uniref:hypothetical protein n=1 Tax=Dysgonomonas sp. 521 TaxID=2302932 RepID=UPI00210219F9|nr:hypothetical protein [Dysgonomonas sp. 521]